MKRTHSPCKGLIFGSWHFIWSHLRALWVENTSCAAGWIRSKKFLWDKMCDFYWQFFHRTYNLKETLRVIHGRNKGENGIIYNSLQNKNLFARSKLYNQCILIEKQQIIEFKPWSFWSKFNILHLPHHLHLQASQYQLPHNLFPMLPNLLGLLKILPLPYPHQHTWNKKNTVTVPAPLNGTLDQGHVRNHAKGNSLSFFYGII